MATRTIALAAVLAIVASVVAAAWLSSPSPSDFNRRARRAAPASRISVSGISPLALRAVVATEDERFYRHQGIDVVGLLRAFPYDLTHLSFIQGASTITEQLAKLLYLNGNDHSPWRKLEDAVLAVRIEHGHSKEQILGGHGRVSFIRVVVYG